MFTETLEPGLDLMTKRVELVANENETDDYAVALMRSVGVQVRTARSRRGLTRKNLAYHSSVSERYLARVESGEANISVVLLSQIARALDVPMLSLLPGEVQEATNYAPLDKLLGTLSETEKEHAFKILRKEFNAARPERIGVALVGLRGAGKSTIGMRLANQFKVPFVRLDEVITDISGLELGELISLVGQKEYRRYEYEALKSTLEDYRQIVIESGGSLVSEEETYNLLRSNYFTVWIQASPEEHLERVRGQGDIRPMKSSKRPLEDLKLILEDRSADYRLADYHLTTSKRSVDECVAELADVVAPYL
ncbi:MAG: shikimate kinase [marine bacterium B5-7]|nr:MAG: shikimate kinase [marine bacterium B5-7]